MVYSNVVYCPNVVVGWRSGVRRSRLCVRCEGYCSSCSWSVILFTYKPLFYISSYDNIATKLKVTSNHNQNLLPIIINQYNKFRPSRPSPGKTKIYKTLYFININEM